MSFGGYNQAFLDALPVAVYGCLAPEGQVLFANRRAIELWGREPRLGREFYCGSLRMYRPDGTLLPHSECPMAKAIHQGRGCKNELVFIERPDGSRVKVLANTEPFRDQASGRLVGAINVFQEAPAESQQSASAAD
jgi:PAS domain-containing protein